VIRIPELVPINARTVGGMPNVIRRAIMQVDVKVLRATLIQVFVLRRAAMDISATSVQNDAVPLVRVTDAIKILETV
jgi:uncharacterized protein (UPF0147 family)